MSRCDTAPPDGASPVIMLRSVPADLRNEELIQWAESFAYEPRDSNGTVVGPVKQAKCDNVLIVQNGPKGGRRAFVQFEDIWAARSVMHQFVYNSSTIMLRGSFPLNLVYSDKMSIRVPGAMRRPVSHQLVEDCGKRRAPHVGSTDTGASRLLLVVLRDLLNGFELDELFWIFSQFGVVEKISAFAKDSKSQVIIQLKDVAAAEAAMSYLDGKEVVSRRQSRGVCTMAIVPSKLAELTFRNEDQHNSDFTALNQHLAVLRELMAITAQSGIPVFNRAALAATLWQERFQPMPFPPVLDFLWGQPLFGDWLVPRQQPEHLGRIPEGTQPRGRVGHCLHIAGSDASLSAQDLFRLSGCFAPVVAVRLLYKHQGCALVQFETTGDRDKARNGLHGLVYRGKRLDVKPSTKCNATNWNGSSQTLQARMCSILDRGVRQPAVQGGHNARPSEVVTFWGIADKFAGEALACVDRETASLRSEHPLAVVPCGGQVSVVMRLPTLDTAVLLVASLNGDCNGPLAQLWPDSSIRVRFAVPAELEELRRQADRAEAAPLPLPSEQLPNLDDMGEGYLGGSVNTMPGSLPDSLPVDDTEPAPELPNEPAHDDPATAPAAENSFRRRASKRQQWHVQPLPSSVIDVDGDPKRPQTGTVTMLFGVSAFEDVEIRQARTPWVTMKGGFDDDVPTATERNYSC